MSEQLLSEEGILAAADKVAQQQVALLSPLMERYHSLTREQLQEEIHALMAAEFQRGVNMTIALYGL